MMSKKFTLSCFKPCEFSRQIKAYGTVTKDRGRLDFNYFVTQNKHLIEFDNKNLFPSRKINLWEKTCFEFFLKPIGLKNYWEFNLSPSGDWNVFKFFDYRKKMSEEKTFSELPFTFKKEKNCFSLFASINIDKLFNPEEKILVSLGMILNHDKSFSYWALWHPNLKPDFHDSKSFIISLK